mmetsp:Transcript_48624/g.72582  ORF Transcript_48624/g.72582 Transcript_48624/m.72582 type:complete len:354 (-) Transcript_48624:190-1251(-)|eukprot:CAMPEP_0194068466 /NCGR_PEP_ID=MMETSP0009_2-20130614/87113_1 /TAXON_ID=210454 /ORGANISM="Grammatophora oceanica, Strain CCMP 410" /LENGTH=353 /DNA_ID=CAMNT_0038721571 /DNA_START=30 /DNA_END=1091 /DNA_ORIENTATION=-
MSFFGLGGGGLKIDIVLDNTDKEEGMALALQHQPSWRMRKNPFWRVGAQPVSPTPNLVMDGMPMNNQLFAIEAGQHVSGTIILSLPPGKKAEHLGIKVTFIGRVEMGQGVHDAGGRPNYDFISLSKELSPPGVIYQSRTQMPFLFRNVDKEHESYTGRNVAVRYFVNVKIERKFLPPLQKEQDVWVQILAQPPTQNDPIKMEVGIEDCLHLEILIKKSKFDLKDIIEGEIHFLLVRIKLRMMELCIIRRETSGDGVAAASQANAMAGTQESKNIFTETQTLIKHEIMDGAPVKDEVIPVRLSLAGIPADLTPTFTVVNNRFSVRYYINLVLVDMDDRRYFKQQEIFLWRKELG